MKRPRIDPGRRWLLIQLHRAHIERILRSRSTSANGEIARRMNEIAMLCDCGRTEAGQQIALMLAQGSRPDLQSIPNWVFEPAEPS